MSYATRYHRDGTITYWSVYDQVWVLRASDVPDDELAAMGTEERDRVTDHLGWPICPHCGRRNPLAGEDGYTDEAPREYHAECWYAMSERERERVMRHLHLDETLAELNRKD